jgi:DNA-binding NarL/FixJ family response regulator
MGTATEPQRGHDAGARARRASPQDAATPWPVRAGHRAGARDTTVRILLADDHVMVRRGLRAVLEEQRDFVICAEAAEGREAVELALAHKPNVVVLDISLPVLNGIEVARQIRKGSPETEVLVFTMHDNDELIAEVLRAGARGYLLKSEAGDQIVNAVAALNRHTPYFSGRVSAALLERFNAGAPAHVNGLTAREREIVQLIAEGNSNKRIAILLDISVKTVETHRSTVMRKLNIRSMAELVRYAVRHKLVEA